MSLKQWFGSVWEGAKRNAPTILTTSSIGLFLVSVIEAAKATPQAMEAVEEKKKEEGHIELTAVQTVQVTWRFYIKSALAFFAASGCAIASLKENNKRIAGLVVTAEAGKNLFQEFQDYRKFVAEKLGKNKEAEIYNNAAQEVVNRNPPPATMKPEFIEGQAPRPICFHAAYGRYFYADYETIREAVNRLNERINSSLEGYVSLNDFYYEICVDATEFGNMVGWSIETGLIKIPAKEDLRYAGTPDGWPCWILEFENPPQYEYQFFRKH